MMWLNVNELMYLFAVFNVQNQQTHAKHTHTVCAYPVISIFSGKNEQ